MNKTFYFVLTLSSILVLENNRLTIVFAAGSGTEIISILSKQNQIDLGILDEQKSYLITAPFHNNSKKTITVTSSLTGCSCIEIIKIPESVSPKTSDTVKFMWKPAKLSPGPKSQRIQVTTNSDKNPVRDYVVNGISKGIWADTNAINLGSLNKSKQSIFEFFVFIADTPDASLDEIQIKDDRLIVKKGLVKKIEKEGITAKKFKIGSRIKDGSIKVWKVSIDWNNKHHGASGQNVSLLSIKSKNSGIVNIPVHFSTGISRVLPAHLVFGVVGTGDTITRNAFVTIDNKDRDVNFEEIKFSSNHDFLKTSIIRTGNKKGKLTCKLSLEEPIDTKVLRGEIVGNINKLEVFRLPYTAILKQSGK